MNLLLCKQAVLYSVSYITLYILMINVLGYDKWLNKFKTHYYIDIGLFMLFIIIIQYLCSTNRHKSAWGFLIFTLILNTGSILMIPHLKRNNYI